MNATPPPEQLYRTAVKGMSPKAGVLAWVVLKQASQGKAGPPAHMQFAVQASPKVLGSPSSQGVPGRAEPPWTPSQSTTEFETQTQFTLQKPGRPNAEVQGVPGMAGPFTLPSQSTVVLPQLMNTYTSLESGENALKV